MSYDITLDNGTSATLEDILLGQTVSGQVNKIQSNFKALNTVVEALDDRVTTVKNEAHKSVSYDTIDDMVTAVKALGNTAFNVADNIFIVATDVPDFWISAIKTTAVTNVTAADLSANGYNNVQVGYYVLNKLETQKVDLTNAVTTNETALTANNILLGNGSKLVKNSGVSITTGGTNGSTWSSASNSNVPTSLAVENRIVSVQNSLNTSINNIIDGTTSAGKTKGTLTLQQNSANAQTFNGSADVTFNVTPSGIGAYTKSEVDTKLSNVEANAGKIDSITVNDTTVPLTNKVASIAIKSGDTSTTTVSTSTTDGTVTITALGKVQDVKVNGSSVVTNGIATITIDDLTAEFTTVSSFANDTNGYYFTVDSTLGEIGVFNSSKNEMVVQRVYDSTNNLVKIYVGSTNPTTVYIRKLSGGAVSSGGSDIVLYQHNITLVGTNTSGGTVTLYTTFYNAKSTAMTINNVLNELYVSSSDVKWISASGVYSTYPVVTLSIAYNASNSTNDALSIGYINSSNTVSAGSMLKSKVSSISDSIFKILPTHTLSNTDNVTTETVNMMFYGYYNGTGSSSSPSTNSVPLGVSFTLSSLSGYTTAKGSAGNNDNYVYLSNSTNPSGIVADITSMKKDSSLTVVKDGSNYKLYSQSGSLLGTVTSLVVLVSNLALTSQS